MVVAGLVSKVDFASRVAAARPTLVRWGKKLSHDQDTAEDLAQEAMARALTRQGLYQERQRFDSWLLSILYHCFVNGYRRQRRDLLHRCADITEKEWEAPSVPSPEAAYEALELVRKSLEGLPPRHQKVVLLVGTDYLTYSEAADELAVPIGTVRSRLARARQTMRDILEGGEARPPRRLERRSTPRKRRKDHGRKRKTKGQQEQA